MNEILFFKVIHNKYLFKNILDKLSYQFKEEKNNLVNKNSIIWLIENGYRATLKRKFISNHPLQFVDGSNETNEDTSEKFCRLFAYLNSDNDNEVTEEENELYKSIFKKFNDYLEFGVNCTNGSNILKSITASGNIKAFKILLKEYEYLNIGSGGEGDQQGINYPILINNCISNGQFKFAKWLINESNDGNGVSFDSFKKEDKKQFYKSILKYLMPGDFSTLSEAIDNQVLKFKRMFKFIKSLGTNRINFTDQSLQYLKYSTIRKLYHDCPVATDFKIKWLLNSCYTYLVLTNNGTTGQYIDGESNQFNDISSKFILNELELTSTIQFKDNELEKRINDQSVKSNSVSFGLVKNLLQMYYSIRDKIFNLKSSLYWIYNNEIDDEFMTFNQIFSNLVKDPSLKGIEISAFEFGSFRLIKHWISIENTNNTIQSVVKSNYKISIFKYCNDPIKQFKFVKEFSENTIFTNVQNGFCPILFFGLVVSYNNQQLIKSTYDLLQDSISKFLKNTKSIKTQKRKYMEIIQSSDSENDNDDIQLDQDSSSGSGSSVGDDADDNQDHNLDDVDDMNVDINSDDSTDDYLINHGIDEFKMNIVDEFDMETIGNIKGYSNLSNYINSVESLEFVFGKFNNLDGINFNINVWCKENRIDLIDKYYQLVNQNHVGENVKLIFMPPKMFLSNQYFIDNSNSIQSMKYILSNPNQFSIGSNISILFAMEPNLKSTKQIPLTTQDIQDIKFIIEHSTNRYEFRFIKNSLILLQLQPLFKWIVETRLKIDKKRISNGISKKEFMFFSNLSYNEIFKSNKIVNWSKLYGSETLSTILERDIEFIKEFIVNQFPSNQIISLTKRNFEQDDEDEEDYEEDDDDEEELKKRSIFKLFKASIRDGNIDTVFYLFEHLPTFLNIFTPVFVSILILGNHLEIIRFLMVENQYFTNQQILNIDDYLSQIATKSKSKCSTFYYFKSLIPK